MSRPCSKYTCPHTRVMACSPMSSFAAQDIDDERVVAKPRLMSPAVSSVVGGDVASAGAGGATEDQYVMPSHNVCVCVCVCVCVRGS